MLPNRSLQSVFIQNFGAMHFADFLSAARILSGVAKRHQRPLSGLTLRIGDVEKIADETGHSALTAVYRQLGDIITQTLRDTDLVTALDGVIHVLLPETPPEHNEVVRKRIEAEIAQIISFPIDLDVDDLDREDVTTMCEEHS